MMAATAGDMLCIIESLPNDGSLFDLKTSVSRVPISLDSVEILQEVADDGQTCNQLSQQVTQVTAPYPGTGPHLGYFPPGICCFENVTRINVAGHKMVHIPACIARLQKLKVLNLSSNTLTSLPAEIGDLAGLRDLDASHNHLRALPPKICQLTGLEALNVMGNQLIRLPDDFGHLGNLVRLGLKSNQLTALPASFTQLKSLVELFITDNKLSTLPEGFGALSSLVKLQASFNPFETLPADMFKLPNLEMFRLAVGALVEWPSGLLCSGGLPRLAWCSLGGNPAAVPVPAVPADLPTVTAAELGLGRKLGAGASGDVFEGTYNGQAVAVKLFRGDVGPDGRVAEEVGISCSVCHPNLTRVRAAVTEPQGLVLDLVTGVPLAQRPTSQHLLRCKWMDGQLFTLNSLLKICSGVASALAYLHSRHMCHGDVYAHNILVGQDNHPVICDFGASYCYPPGEAFWETMEVNAYGLFLADMVQRLGPESSPQVQQLRPLLQQLVEKCVAVPPASRPGFKEVVEDLQRLMPLAAAAS